MTVMNFSDLSRLWNDARIRRITIQVVLVALVVFCFWWLISNTSQNLDKLNKSIGFDFLSQNAGFQIAPTLGTWLFSYEVGAILPIGTCI
jgi:general L-amino acid transport system permease protein